MSCPDCWSQTRGIRLLHAKTLQPCRNPYHQEQPEREPRRGLVRREAAPGRVQLDRG